MIDVARIHAASPAPLVAAQRLGLEIHRSARADRVLVLCPWHAERTPSCSIATKDGRIVAHCYACGAGGDLLELVAAVNALDARVDFRRVAELAAELVGVRLGGAARMSRQRPVDPRVELAHRIDVHADRWLRGLPVNHDEVVEAARPRELIEAVDRKSVV